MIFNDFAFCVFIAYALWTIYANQKTNKLLEGILLKMPTQADLDAAIAGLPAAIEAAVEAALAPVIQAIKDKAGNIDFTPEIAQLNAVGGTVATQVATDLTPPVVPPPPVTPPVGGGAAVIPPRP